jgi:hypothetical protein
MPIVNVEGVGQVNFPDSMSSEQITSAIQKDILPQFPEIAAKQSRTMGEIGKDILASAGSGLGSLAQFPGQVYGLVTGDMDQGGLQQIGRNLQEYSEEAKSTPIRAREALRSQKIAQADGFFSQAGVAIAETLKDPSLLSSFIFEQAPQLLGTAGGGYATKQGVKLLMRNATEEVLAKSGTRGAIATSAVMQGADVGADTYERIYNELMMQGYPEAQAREQALAGGRKAAVEAAALTGITSIGPGASIERALTRGAAGAPKTGIIKGTLGEIAGESIEEAGGKLASNIEFQKVKPEADIMEGVGAAAGMGALGGGLFGFPSSFVNKANAIELERAKKMVEDAKKRAADNAQPEQVEIPTDPRDPNSGTTILYVSPTGQVGSSLSDIEIDTYRQQAEEQQKQAARIFTPDVIKSFGISPKANMYRNEDIINADISDPAQAAKVKAELEKYLSRYPNANANIRQNITDYLARPEFQPPPTIPTQITEATTTPQADQAAIQQRLAEGFRNRPEIQKIYEDYNKKMQEGDADKAALSAFNSIVTPQVIKSFGIPANSSVYNDQDLINADLTNPETADQIRIKLMEIKDQTKSAKIKDNIDKYLNRSEFITPTYVDQFLNPPREVGEENLDHFVFVNADGEIESKYGTIVEKDGKKYAKYPQNKFQKGGDRELNENVLVNPKSPDEIELMTLYKAKEKLMKEPDDFKSWLIGKGVKPEERSDISIESRLPHKMFRKEGYSLDDLVRMAIEEGILHEPDFQEGIGGVESMRRYIKMAVDGDFVPTANNMRNMNDLENLQQHIENLERQTKGTPEELIAEQMRGEEEAPVAPPAAPVEPTVEAPPVEETVTPEVTEATVETPAAPISDEIPLYEYSLGINAAMMDSVPNPNIVSKAAVDKLVANNLVKQDQDGTLHLLPKGNAMLADIREATKFGAKEKSQAEQEAMFAKYFVPLDQATGNLKSEEVNRTYTNKAFNLSEADQRIEKEISGKTLQELSDWSIKKAPNPFARVIASMVNKRIKELANRGIKLDFKVHSGNNRLTSMYDNRGNVNFEYSANKMASISLNLNGAAVMNNQRGYPSGMNYTTILHELLHVATSGQLFMRSSKDPLVVELSDLRNQVVKYFNDRVDKKDLTPFMKRIHTREINALRNIDELVSWGLTDSDMQSFLSEIKVGEKTAFTKLVELIREVLGINKNYESALDRLIKTSESILSEDINTIGDRVVSRGYSFGEKITNQNAPSGQGSLFQKEMKASFEGVDEAYAEAIRKQFTQEEATVGQKFENLKDNFFEKMITGVFDEFRAIKKYTTEGYMMARLSKSIDGGLQGLLEHGQVYLKDGALDVRPDTKGLLEILEPLGAEVDQYQIWKALSRDSQMPADKRSFDAALVAGRDNLTKGTINGKSRKEVYEKARLEENQLNKSVLDVALETGLIDRQAYQVFSNDINYIPFYKMMEDGDVNSVSASSKLTGQYFSKALKGGEKKTNDLMENVLLNWSHILSAAMKNQAAVKTVQAAEDMKAAVKAKPMDGKYPPNTIKVMEDGKTVHYTLTDPDLVDAISTISYLGPKSAFLDVAKGFTNALRYGITLSPAYKVRNLIRDSLQSAAVSELGPNMFENVYNGLRMTKKGDPTFMSALAGGGIFEMGTAHEGDQAKFIKRLIDKGVREATILDTPEKIKSKLQDLLDSYNELGNKFENANRLALYKKLRESGKSHLEASYSARDLMDFSMQGQFRAVKVIGSVVPFFNARLQGLYKLGRDGITPTYRVICNATTGAELQIGDKEKAQRFMAMSSAIAMASILLYGAYKDDEDFQRREGWDRDNFWWFKIGDTQFRIPKPFEIGAFGTIAERTYEQIVDENVEGKVFGERLNHILMDTFSLNPMPQMIKPLIDLYANKDSFTSAPIESAGMERLSKQERQTNKTSGVAIALGGISEGAAKILTFNPDAQGFSPVQMDYAIKAYLGWLGATAVSTADLAVEPFKEGTRVRPPLIDTLAMGFIKTEPQTQSKYMTQFYENNARLQSALADMRHYAELGDMEKVTKIIEEKGEDIALAKVYDKATKQLAELRKQSRIIEQNKEMSTDDKRAEMNRIKILMSDIARQMEQIRKSR